MKYWLGRGNARKNRVNQNLDLKITGRMQAWAEGCMTPENQGFPP